MKTQPAATSHSGSGFTTLETTVALAVFITTAAVSAPFFTALTSYYTESLFRSNLMESAKIAQERLHDDLVSAKVLSLTTGADGNPILTFVVPVELNNGTKVDYLDSAGDVFWGCVESSGPMQDATGSQHRLILGVVPSSTVAESAARLDLNNDGDTVDTFQLGSLRLRTTGGEETLLNSDRVVISQDKVGAFDMDGDGVKDPLFSIVGEAFTDLNANGIHDTGEALVDTNLNGRWDGILTLNLLALDILDSDGRGHSSIYRCSVRLLNN